MNSRKIGSLGEFLQLIVALFGGAKDIGVEVGIQYYEWVKRWSKISVVIALTGIVFFALSEVFNQVVFNAIGVFLMAILILGWLLLIQPLYIFGEQLAKFDALKRLFGRITLAVVVLLVLLLLTSKAPAGTDGISLIGFFLAVLFGTALAGTQITRKKIGIHLILWSALFAAITSFSLTTKSIPSLLNTIDRSIVNNSIFKANELDFKLENLIGDGPLIFLDGEPLWWCRQDSTRISGYRCFDQPGYDQTTNEKLFPISPHVIHDAINRLKGEERRVEQQRARHMAEEEAFFEQKRIEEAETKRKTYIDKYIITGNNKVKIAIALTRNNQLDSSFAQQMLAILPSLSGSHVFTQQAVTDGIFDRIYNGGNDELKKLELSSIAEKLLVGKVKEEFQNNQAINGVVDAFVEIEFRLLDTATGRIINSGNYNSEIQLGHSKIEAQRKAEEVIIKQIASNLF